MTDHDDYLAGDLPRTPTEPSKAELLAVGRVTALRRFLMVLSGLAVLLLVVGTAYIVLTIRTTQVDSVERSKKTNVAATQASSASQRIEDCTTPGRSCYERSQSQITSAVVDINRVTVLASACAAGAVQQSVAEIQACVIKGLRSDAGVVPRMPSPSTAP